MASLAVALVGAGYFSVHAERPPEGAPPDPLQNAATAPPGAAQASAPSPKALLDQYCITCHNDRLKTGGLSLDNVDVSLPGQAPEVWEKVAHKLRTGDMPPTGRPRPEQSVSRGLASYLETELDRAAATLPNAGRVAPHRLNRTEYTNAVRDLLGLEIPVSLLPIENSTGGFDNIAGALTVSPMLLERYMTLSRQVSRLAVGDSTMMVAPVLYGIDGTLKMRDRTSEDLPFGARGVTIRHSFPLDGEYSIQIRLRRTQNEYIRGLGRHVQPIDVRLDGERVKLFDQAGLLRGTPPAEGYTQDDLGDTDFEKNSLEGDSALEARFFAKAGVHVVAVALPARRWDADESFVLPSGARPEEERGGNIAIKTVEIGGPFGAKAAEESASRKKIFTCRPATEAELEPCATKILSTIARRAYRRPVNGGDVQTLLRFCRAGLSRGFDGCIQSGIERILASPHFLFRVPASPANAEGSTKAASVAAMPSSARGLLLRRQDTPASLTALSGSKAATTGGIVRLSDLDLASRLSFFLWSSIPDDELLTLAERGTLHTDAVLTRQVKRMLADPRSRALVDNFSAQWLELRRLDGAAPVEDAFPDFDGELRQSFKEETERVIDSMIREDRPIPDLLTASYSFLNERLARHYGIPNIIGNRFRRVTMPPNRVGLLGHGSILTVTSQANRTSPVLRGKWVLDNILGSPVPPPPPDVPALKPDDDDGAPLTGRAALERHRSNAVCANCHARMDPWGFALENYNGVGAWRAMEGGKPIDTKAVLLDGTKLDGPTGVQQVLQARRDQFVKTVSEKLMVYALGRPVEYYDRPALRKITTEAAAHDNRWSSVILGIVNSMPFQYQSKGAE
jgi:mono/diheme cytochrome c family protein